MMQQDVRTEPNTGDAAVQEKQDPAAVQGTDQRQPAAPGADGASAQPGTPPAPAQPAAPAGEQDMALFAEDEARTFRSRWDDIQAGFVDDPRQAVQAADSLVTETMRRLSEVFEQQRSSLEQQWDTGDDVSTEDLRLALRRYRSFFDRLLAL